jgi:hypothetical protein
MFYKVPWLEKVVKKHLTSKIVTSSSATMEWVDTVKTVGKLLICFGADEPINF